MDIINIFVPEACEREASPVGYGGPVPIGYVGESGVRQVVLDFSPWVETYGPGALTLMVRRNGDADAYPVALEIDGSTAAWTVSNVDTHIYGVGRAQYMYVVDGENVKSAIFQTFVDKSVTQPGSDPPDPYEGWVQHLTELGAETLVNAQAAAESAEAAETAKTETENAEQGAAESEEDAKAWAVGERGGEPVQPGDPTYHNNAKYYAEQASVVAPVQSVNGKTGVVELDAEDVGALPDSSTLDDILNGETYARTTLAQVQQIGQNAADVDALETDVDAIEAKIPPQASIQNKLADKDFVNSSINSAAAYFRGSFPTRAALFAVAWQTSDPTAANYVSNNDYAYVQDDENHDDEAWRYLYVLQPAGQNNGWQPQFKVNDTPLTAAQLAALNSGATAENIASIAEKYVKPVDGIPASDMTAAVRTSLGKADTALQSVPNTYRTAAAQDVIDQQQDAAIAAKYTELKSALNYIKQGNADGFINSYVNNNGVLTTSQKTIINARPYNYGYDNLTYIKCAEGYDFTLYAWSKSFSYLGALRTDGTFKRTGGTIKKLTELNLQDYPDNFLRLGINHNVSGSYVDIAPSEASNVNFYYRAENALLLSGKRISVIGDSISAFTGYTSPGAPTAYYPRDEAGLYAVSQMYWGALAERTNMVIDTIDAYGGSTIGTTWDTNYNYTPFTDESRLSRLGTPDFIIVEGGINDFGGNPLGEYPADSNYSNMYEFRTSYAYLLNQLKTRYPAARIVCLSMLTPKTYNNTQFPEKQTEVKQALASDKTPHYLYEFNAAIKELCARYGCIFCDIYDITNYYVATASPLGPHPSSAAHLYMANRIESALIDLGV